MKPEPARKIGALFSVICVFAAAGSVFFTIREFSSNKTQSVDVSKLESTIGWDDLRGNENLELKRKELDRILAELERAELERAELERAELERAESERLESARPESEQVDMARAIVDREEIPHAEIEQRERIRVEMERAESSREESKEEETSNTETELIERWRAEIENFVSNRSDTSPEDFANGLKRIAEGASENAEAIKKLDSFDPTDEVQVKEIARASGEAAELENANIAFPNPKRMVVGSEIEFDLLISRQASERELSDQVAGFTSQTMEVETARVDLEPIVRARLRGSGFTTTLLEGDDQALTESNQLRWRWRVKANEAGEDQVLVLQIFYLKNISGIPTALSVKSFERRINVHVSVLTLLGDSLNSPIASGIIATVLAAFLLYLVRRIYNKYHGAPATPGTAEGQEDPIDSGETEEEDSEDLSNERGESDP